MPDTAPKKRMPMRLRKFLGMIVLLFWMILYTLIAAALWTRIPQIHVLFDLAYFMVAGVAWVIPVKYLLNWMQAPDEQA